MNKSRILRAIEVLSEITPAQWKYDIWIGHAVPIGVKGAKPTCGTVGCAWGWIGLDPQAQKQGVYFEKFDFGDFTTIRGPFYEKSQGTSACAAYFDIDHSTATTIFVEAGNYIRECYLEGVPVSPQHIIELLQKVLAGEEIEEIVYEEINDEE
jgi:hypothetical protein